MKVTQAGGRRAKYRYNASSYNDLELHNRPKRMGSPDIFVSYKRQDQPAARQLAEALAAEGWKVWWDPALRAGEHFDQVIEQALADCRCAIVLWSPRSIASQYVRDEANFALEQGKLVPAWIEHTELPFRFRGLHTQDLSDWKGDRNAPVFRELVDDIRARIGEPGAPTALPQQEPARPPVNRRRRYVALGALALVAIGIALWLVDINPRPGADCLATVTIEAVGHDREALTLVARSGGDWTRSFPVSGARTTIEIPAAHTNGWHIDVVWDGAVRSRFGSEHEFVGCQSAQGLASAEGDARLSIEPL